MHYTTQVHLLYAHLRSAEKILIILAYCNATASVTKETNENLKKNINSNKSHLCLVYKRKIYALINTNVI